MSSTELPCGAWAGNTRQCTANNHTLTIPTRKIGTE